MEEILRQKVSEQQDITSRVSMLLAGTALTTTSGVRNRRRETVQEVPYDALGNLNDYSSSQVKYSMFSPAYLIVILRQIHRLRLIAKSQLVLTMI